MLDIDAFEEFQPSLTIRHRDTGLPVSFCANPNQRKCHAAYRKQLRANSPLRVISVKARRTGFSRDALSILFSHLLSTPNTRATVVAHLKATSKELYAQVTDWYKAFPIRLGKPTQMELQFPHKDGSSYLTWTTGKTFVAGRGTTNSALLMSEAAYIDIAAYMSLLSTVSKLDPNSIIFQESTANGKTGVGEPFYRTWTEAWEAAESKRKYSSYVPVFLGFLEDPECVRDPKEVRDAPASDLERELMKDFRASKAQIAWVRDTLMTYCNGLEDVFTQEYPWTPDVAFLTSGQPAFSRSELRIVSHTVREGQLIFAGRLFGGNGEYAPLPGKILTGPFRGTSGPWRIFRWPEPGHFYYIGADSARGHEEGRDYAASTIFDGETGEQVAGFLDQCRPDELAFEMNSAGKIYKHGQSYGKLLLEITGTTGGITQSIMRDRYNYPNLYLWRGARNDRPKGRYGMSSLGWEMTERSRRRALEQFRTDLAAIERGACGPVIRDTVLAAQIEIAQRSGGGNWDWQVEEGHDDYFTSALMAWVCRSDFPPPRILSTPHVPNETATHEEQFNRLMHSIKTEESGFGFLTSTYQHQQRFIQRERQQSRFFGGWPATEPDGIRGSGELGDQKGDLGRFWLRRTQEWRKI